MTFENVTPYFPSFAIRVHSEDERWAGKYDIHEEPLFARGGLPLTVVVAAHHWLWGAGLGALALFILNGVILQPGT